ncbi:uncharacterized protein [Typha angustifolia]|uniref:uncharacterized protein n=1 Tax=Typha angustifolia TaxID=59011 RepID=UPI003C2D7331
MGASSSTEQSSPRSQEQQQEESLAASTASLPVLRAAFSKLSQPNSTTPVTSLQEAFSVNISGFASESLPVPDEFPQLVQHLGPSVVSLFFTTSDGDSDWVDFLKRYNRCCARMPVAQSLNMLYRLYSAACREAGFGCNLEFDSDEDDGGKVGGSFGSNELLMFLWMCWIMMQCRRISMRINGEKDVLVLPDVKPLILSAMVSCGVVGDDEGIWNCNVLGFEKSISVQKLQTWVLTTAPGLVQSLSHYVREKLQDCMASEENADASLLASDSSSMGTHNNFILTRGGAWAISLTLRSALSEELLGVSFVGMGIENLLYRSSVHGKGLSRFWSNVEGYNGSLIILLSAKSADAHESDPSAGRWVIGILTEQGFENKDTYFGRTGYLYAIDPIFHVRSPSGKEQNFMYCHLHSTRLYEPRPKPVGLAFGGTLGNERIFLDEDFARVTVRHHVVDKTYQTGSLIPNQGFLSAEASILEVEVWGFGGERAKEQQNAYKKRETLFSEQRRKVDLKNFANWEDSPEKLMMDMMSDPNKVRREDR